MTIIEAPHPHPSLHPTVADTATDPPVAPRPLFSRHAGLLALAAGTLIVLAQLIMLPFDPKDHVVTSQSPG